MRKVEYDRRPKAQVECGGFRWKGRAKSLDDALIGAFSRNLPKNPALLLRARLGHQPWEYIDFESALKIAGYSVRKTKHGFKVV